MIDTEQLALTITESLVFRIQQQNDALEAILEAVIAMRQYSEDDGSVAPWTVQDLIDNITNAYEMHLGVTPLVNGPYDEDGEQTKIEEKKEAWQKRLDEMVEEALEEAAEEDGWSI